MLAFLGNYPGDNGFPSLKLGGRSCRAATSAQKRIAPGLVNCVGLAPAIEQCQRIGKPVLLSLGGSTSTSQFRSAPEAVQFASTLWSLFGGDFSNSTTLPLRPFGPNIALDGFDIDNENDNAGFYAEFARALRVKFATVPGRRFYLSGSPRCVLPSTSLSVDAMMQLDWVWPRFYAAAKCQITNTAGFLSAVQSWTQQLAGGPKLYLGLAASKLTVSGHAPGAEIADRVGQIDKAHAKSIGGIMLWDGSLAMVNDEKGTNYLKYAKQAVSRSFGSGN
jgi:chitinase